MARFVRDSERVCSGPNGWKATAAAAAPAAAAAAAEQFMGTSHGCSARAPRRLCQCITQAVQISSKFRG